MEKIIAFLQDLCAVLFGLLLIVIFFAIAVLIIIGIILVCAWLANYIHSL